MICDPCEPLNSWPVTHVTHSASDLWPTWPMTHVIHSTADPWPTWPVTRDPCYPLNIWSMTHVIHDPLPMRTTQQLTRDPRDPWPTRLWTVTHVTRDPLNKWPMDPRYPAVTSYTKLFNKHLSIDVESSHFLFVSHVLHFNAFYYYVSCLIITTLSIFFSINNLKDDREAFCWIYSIVYSKPWTFCCVCHHRHSPICSLKQLH